MTLPRALPDTTFIEDPELRRILDAMSENFRVWGGEVGDPDQKLVNVNELVGSNIAGNDNGTLYPSDTVKNQSTFKGSIQVEFDAAKGRAEGVFLIEATIPDNSFITKSWYEVITTFTSSSDAATIGIGIEEDDATGIKAAVAISAGGNAWDAGVHDGDNDYAAANFTTKTTSNRRVIVTVAGGQDLTAGKFILYLEYTTSE